MKRLFTSPLAKAFAALLAVLMLVGGFWGTLVTLFQWDTLWSGEGYYDSTSCYQDLYDYENRVEWLLDLRFRQEREGSLSYLDTQRMRELERDLSIQSTNFRYRVLRNDTGAEVIGNLGGASIEEAVHSLQRMSHTITSGRNELVENDYQSGESGVDTEVRYLLYVDTGEGMQAFTGEDAQQAEEYGWYFQGNGWIYNWQRDSRVFSVEYALEYGVADPLVVHDVFWEGAQGFAEYARYLPLVAVVALAMDVLGVLLVILHCSAAGRRRGEVGYTRGLFDKIPLDVLAALLFFAVALLVNAGDSITYNINKGFAWDLLVGLALISCAVAACVQAMIITCAVRVKTGTLLSNNLIWLCCRTLGRAVGRAVADWPLTGRTVLFFLLYLVGTILTTFTIVLIPVYQGVVLWGICHWTKQWKAIRTGTVEIVGGDPDYKINTYRMYRDLRQHAEALNDLGGAISSAVDERMKSERFKAELITNVSHDLKTPLTSIISYVDLLKKEGVTSPRADEYLEVIDRKSQRLKKLTEDLVDASKASTGNLSVVRERLGVVQFVQQATGEFEGKFAQRGLTLLLSLPKDEAFVEADGRHLWRIVDNLLTNCQKYALEHTRVYLDVIRWDGSVTLSVKNISAQALNIPAEQLMERFVRGEEARSTEGSGLGLSIARSLTEVQGGTFHLSIDGDLFKVVVVFPEVAPPTPPQTVELTLDA